MSEETPKPDPPSISRYRKPVVAAIGFVICLIVGTASALKLDKLSRAASANSASGQLSAYETGAVFEKPSSGLIRSKEDADVMPWIRNAALYPYNDPAPRLALIIEETGSDMTSALTAVGIQAPLTFAISPDADSADKTALAARSAGREVLLLLPMQSEDTFNTSPNPVSINSSRDELVRRMKWNFAQIDGFVGVMNRFGEAVTRDGPTMRAVLETLKDYGYGFVDARTHRQSIAGALARRMSVPVGDRDFAVPRDASIKQLNAILDESIQHAEKWGTAIVTVPAEHRMVKELKSWVGTYDSSVKIAPLTAVVNRLRMQ